MGIWWVPTGYNEKKQKQKTKKKSVNFYIM